MNFSIREWNFSSLGEGLIRKSCISCTIPRIQFLECATSRFLRVGVAQPSSFLNYWPLYTQFLTDQFLIKRNVYPGNFFQPQTKFSSPKQNRISSSPPSTGMATPKPTVCSWSDDIAAIDNTISHSFIKQFHFDSNGCYCSCKYTAQSLSMMNHLNDVNVRICQSITNTRHILTERRMINSHNKHAYRVCEIYAS